MLWNDFFLVFYIEEKQRCFQCCLAEVNLISDELLVFSGNSVKLNKLYLHARMLQCGVSKAGLIIYVHMFYCTVAKS